MKLQTRSIKNILSILTAIISLIVAISIPAVYFIVAYQYTVGAVNTEMAFSARTVERLVANNPQSWQFEEIRLQEILERHLDHSYPENWTIRDLQGHVIADVKEPLTRPALTFRQAIHDSGIEVARIEVERSIAPLAVRTAIITAASILLGIIIFLAFRFFPLRVVRKAYEELQESESKYKLLTEKMSDIVWIADLNMRTHYISPSVGAVLGFNQGDLPMTAQEQMTPASLAKAAETLLRELAIEERGNGNPDRKINLLLEYYHKDGSIRWLDTTITGLRNDRGVLTGLHGVSRDITERRKTEEALRESEERYRRITENMSDLVCEVDSQGIIKYASPSHLRVVGYTIEDLMGRSVYEFVHPEDLERIARRVRNGEVREVEYRYRHKDGHYAWLRSIDHSLRNEKGEHVGSVISSSDITIRRGAEEAIRKSEERFRSMIQSSLDIILILDKDGLIFYESPSVEQVLKYRPGEINGKNPLEFIHPDDVEMVAGELVNLHKSINSGIPTEFRFRKADGSWGLFEAVGKNLIDDPGINGIVITAHDITERKKAKDMEIQLIQAQKMESVGRLAGGVAHDFNNMLSVIMGNAEMAMMKVKPSEPLYKELQEILNAGQRSSDLTRQLLAFARKQTVSPKVLDLNDTIAGMLKMLRRLIGEDIDLRWHAGSHLWKVKIDPSQVDQLLANLMVNARDAIEKAGRITIETSNTICDEAYCKDRVDCIPGEYVVLAVSDNGCGMDKETMSNIFEPFFTTKKEGQGTGLGLATVYGIAKQNNGFVYVYSEPNQGATFRIYLPRHVDEGVKTIDDEPEPEVPGGTETIFIVEDDPTVLQISKNMLEMLGYQVLAANNKDQALQLAGDYDGNIDLLLTDVVMPGMNGKELSERILAIRPSLKCLYMSGYTADIIARQGVLKQGVKFISKPFSVKDLAAKVREVLG